MTRVLLALLLLVGLSVNAEARSARAHGCLPSSIKAMLAKIDRTWGKTTIISSRGDRPRLRRGKPSYHVTCRAVDFNVKANRFKVAAWLRKNWKGGVGVYSGRMIHIHIDVGPRATWHKRV